MKKYIITALLALGLLSSSDLIAGPHRDLATQRQERKERKMRKKEKKVNRKLFQDHGMKAAKKEDKSRKKEYKMEKKDKTLQ